MYKTTVPEGARFCYNTGHDLWQHNRPPGRTLPSGSADQHDRRPAGAAGRPALHRPRILPDRARHVFAQRVRRRRRQLLQHAGRIWAHGVLALRRGPPRHRAGRPVLRRRLRHERRASLGRSQTDGDSPSGAPARAAAPRHPRQRNRRMAPGLRDPSPQGDRHRACPRRHRPRLRLSSPQGRKRHAPRSPPPRAGDERAGAVGRRDLRPGRLPSRHQRQARLFRPLPQCPRARGARRDQGHPARPHAAA